MIRYLLDTNVCVHALKNEFGVKQLIAETGITRCFLSQITIAELLFGVENSAPERRSLNRQNVEQFQALFISRVLSIDPVLAEYARQKVMLRRMGRPVDDFDLLIGATAIVHELTLVTRNTRHFADMNGIKLVNWIDL
jgi:tRNA(fMet)-specific endonuclease VapC